MTRTNELGQPIGEPLPKGWRPPTEPAAVTLNGRYVTVEPLQAAVHGKDLYRALQEDTSGAGWTYLMNGPYAGLEDFLVWLQSAELSTDPLFSAYVDQRTARAVGYGAFMRMDAAMGCVEVGNLRMSPLLQRTAMSTEAMHLKMAYAFKLGYRRYEWKCDALNAPSRQAAARLGFTFEGIFRNATHYKGRSRDTAWYSITDDEWPAIRAAHNAWLHPDNFDANGHQKRSLGEFIRGSAT